MHFVVLMLLCLKLYLYLRVCLFVVDMNNKRNEHTIWQQHQKQK